MSEWRTGSGMSRGVRNIRSKAVSPPYAPHTVASFPISRHRTPRRQATHHDSLVQSAALIQLGTLCIPPHSLVQPLLREPAEILKVPVIAEKIVVPGVIVPQTATCQQPSFGGRRGTYLTPTMFRSTAVISVSIIRSCHVKSPPLNALLSLYTLISSSISPGRSYSLHIHRNTRLTDHDRHLAQSLI